MNNGIYIPVSPGELLDKITILEIKKDRIEAPSKQANVRRELEELSAVAAQTLRDPERQAELERLTKELRDVNERLWDVEDELRKLEAKKAFDEEFVRLARSVYHLNDRRAELKRNVSEILNSGIVEEKSYARYQ